MTSSIMVKFMFACIWYHWHQTKIFFFQSEEQTQPSRKSLSLICWWQFRQDWACIIRLSDVRNYRISHEMSAKHTHTFWVRLGSSTHHKYPDQKKLMMTLWMAWRSFGLISFYVKLLLPKGSTLFFLDRSIHIHGKSVYSLTPWIWNESNADSD